MPEQCHFIDHPDHGRRKVVAAFDGGGMSSDGGYDAADRDPARCEHSVRDVVAQRLFGLAPGYEDINDHDTLSADSLLALAPGRPDVTGQGHRRKRDRGFPLAGSSALNRLEPGTPETARMTAASALWPTRACWTSWSGSWGGSGRAGRKCG